MPNASCPFLLLLLPSTKSQTLGDTAQPETAEQLVDAQPAQQAIDQSTESQTIQQFTHQTQDAAEQQPDGGDDLEERFAEQVPQRVQLLLSVRHVRDLLLCVLDRRHDGGRKLLERIGQLVFFLRGLAALRARFGVRGDVPVGIQAPDGAVAFLQNASALLDLGLDLFDQFFFVQLFFGFALRGFDEL